MNTHIIIPARWSSSRFPGKPLAPIHGKSMLQWVFEQCLKVERQENISVATDDDRIQTLCSQLGISCLRTSSTNPTGTDRLAEANRLYQKGDLIINVQGDEPMVAPETITTVIREALLNPGVVVNAMCSISSIEEYNNRNVPKAVCDENDYLMYMSREPIPRLRTGEPVGRAKKQVCVYAFPRERLAQFAAVGDKTALESQEDIEILRFLEIGVPVKMVEVPSGSIAVDVPSDIRRVEEAMTEANKVG